MSVPTGLPGGLAFLPTWLNGSRDPLAFDAALAQTRLPERPDYAAANAFLLKARRSMVEERRDGP